LLITSQDDIYIVEIGARLGGDNIGADLVPLSTGYDFVSGVIDIAMGQSPVIEKNRSKYAGIYYLTPTPGIVKRITDNTDKYNETVKSEVTVSIGDEVIYPVKKSADRSGYFIYQANERFGVNDPGKIIEIHTA